MSTARAQPFSINISDDVEPFDPPRPTRKPRTRSSGIATSASRKPSAKAKAKEVIQAHVASPTRTTHYALRLEPITLGSARAPSPPDAPEIAPAPRGSRTAEISGMLNALVPPVQMTTDRRRAVIWSAAVYAICVGVLFVALHGAIHLRQQSDTRMSEIERQIALRTHNVSIHARDVSEAHAIDNTNMGSRDLDRVLADLAWTQAAKSPDSRLRSWSWSPDQIIAEANRPAAFAGADRPVRRRSGASRRGVWSFTIIQNTASRLAPIEISGGRRRR